MEYTKITFRLNPKNPAIQVLHADVDMLGFESVVETDEGLECFIPSEDFQDFELSDLMISNLDDLEVNIEKEVIKKQNWNAEWERQFEPIFIGENHVIRAPFHAPFEKLNEVIITPKMSFGTGHHETTFMISNYLLNTTLPETILDMGCGTGVLAIIAGLKGVKDIVAIDIEDWAVENTIENFELNNLPVPEVILGGAPEIPNRKFNLILANINRNILTQDMHVYSDRMNAGAQIVFSGFYTTDVPVIMDAAEKNGLEFVNVIDKNNWAMTVFKKK